MIKKLLVSFFLCLFILPAMAELNVLVDEVVFRQQITAQVPADKQKTVAQVLTEKMHANQNKGVSTNDLLDLCSVVGWDVKKSQDKDTCYNFVNSIIKGSIVDLKNVCGPDKGKTGKTEKCINVFKDTQVDQRAAIALQVLYAKIKLKDDIICSKNKIRKDGLQDYIACTSRDRSTYYEFEFDDAVESKDTTRRNGIIQGVCKGIYGVEFRAAGCASGGYGAGACWGDICSTSDATMCKNIDAALQEMGVGTAEIKNNSCAVTVNVIQNAKDLKKVDKLDSFAFCGGIQIKANASLDSQVEEYVKSQLDNVKSFKCQAADIKYTGGGCTEKLGNYADDVLRCTINGKDEVDFVFDDLAETWKYISDGGYQGISCIASNGTFDSKRCQGLNENGCNQLKQVAESGCPECKQVYWDAANNLCILPASVTATNLQKGIKVTGVTIMVVGAAVLTAATGGAAAPGTFAAVATAGNLFTIGGAGLVMLSEIATTFGIYTQDVASEINTCLIKSGNEGAACAKQILKKLLQKMESYKKDLSEAEAKALDEQFAALFSKIPAEDSFWEWLDNPKDWDCNQYGCVLKNKTQIWQGVRIAGNVGMILGSALKLVSGVPKTIKQIQEIKKLRELRLIDNMKNGVPMIKDVANGYNSTLLANNVISQGVTINGKVYNLAKNSELAAQLIKDGHKVGDTLKMLVGTEEIEIVLTATEAKFNVAALAGMGVGTAGLIMDGKSSPFMMARPGATPQNGQPETVQPETVVAPIVIPIKSETPAQKTTPTKTGTTKGTPVVTPPAVSVGTVDGTVQPVTTVDTMVIPLQSDEPVQTVVTPSPVESVPATPDVDDKKSGKKKGISGLGVAAIGAGVAGLGVGAAVLATAGKKSSKAATAATTVNNPNVNLFNDLKSRANGFAGFAGDSDMKLLPIDTIVGTQEKIVSIAGHAVVVVQKNKNIIPFMVDTVNGIAQWVPFTNVNEITGVFNRYSGTNADATVVNQLASQLNQILSPLQMQYFASQNSDGVQFLMPNTKGYKTINNNTLRNGRIVVYQTPPDGYLGPDIKILRSGDFFII